MLNLFDNNKTYYDDFVYYLDRGKNLNVIFSFNFSKFVLDANEKLYGIFSDFNKDNYQIKVFLTKNQDFKNYIELFDSVEKINLNNIYVDSYMCKKNVNNLNGKYKVLVRISYSSLKNQYIDYQLPAAFTYDTAEYNNLKYEKILNEVKYAFFEQKSSNLDNQYMFYSQDIEIDFNKKFVFNLYDIYSDTITYTNLFNYLSALEVERGIKFDGSLTTNNYLDKEIKKLDFNFINNSGDKTNYYSLMAKVFQNSLDQLNYNDINYVKNVFIQKERRDRNRKEAIPTYETLAGSLTSTACENNLFNDTTQNVSTTTFKETDPLLLSFVYDNINNIEINDFWKDDITLLPVYFLDVQTKYKIYYCSELQTDSMTQVWKVLDKQAMENLSSGNYLCKIINESEYLSNHLMEDVFILSKNQAEVQGNINDETFSFERSEFSAQQIQQQAGLNVLGQANTLSQEALRPLG